MQNTKNKSLLVLSVTLILALIFTALRIFLLYKNFDFEEGFFKVRAFATAFYLALSLSAFLLVIFRKKYSPDFEIKKGGLSSFCDILLGVSFIILALALLADKNYLFLFLSLISVLSYFVSAFSKEKNTLSSVLNLAPLLYFAISIVISFISISSKANSYNSFSDILALIAISFFILYEGKPLEKEEYPSLYAVYLVPILLIAPSVIPDIITIITKEVPITIITTANNIIKLFYLFVIIIKAARTIKEN